MKRVIEGINPIPGFNGSQNIDLNVYQEIDIPTQIDGTFSGDLFSLLFLYFIVE